MRKKMFLFAILAMLLFVVAACAPEGAIAGKAIKTKDFSKQKPVLPSSGKAEICDNNVDDNGDKKADCADPQCSGFISTDAQKRDALCAKGSRWTCSVNVPSGGVVNVDDSFDALCSVSGGLSRWMECNSAGDVEKKGKGGFAVGASSSGTYPTVAGKDYFCGTYKGGAIYYESWISCGGKGPDGVAIKEGEMYGSMTCQGGKWITETCDNLKDDNGNGLKDCNDPQCAGFVSVIPSGNSLSLGIKHAESVCVPVSVGIKNADYEKESERYDCFTIGKEIPGYNLLCAEIEESKHVWAECDTDGKLAKAGFKATALFKKGEMLHWKNKDGKKFDARYLCYNDEWLHCNTLFGVVTSDVSGTSSQGIDYTVQGYTCDTAQGMWKKN